MNKIDPLLQKLATTAKIIRDNAIKGYFGNENKKKTHLNTCRLSIAQLVKYLKDFDKMNQGEHNG